MMLFGVGIDSVDVAELAARLARKSFLNLFTADELAYADFLPLQRNEILAGRFAAKEAFVKALGTGLRAEWSLQEIAVVHDAHGRPVIQLSDRLESLMPEGGRIHCSITHTRTTATAIVVIEMPEERT